MRLDVAISRWMTTNQGFDLEYLKISTYTVLVEILLSSKLASSNIDLKEYQVM